MANALDNQGGLDDLFAATCDELRRLAYAVKGRDMGESRFFGGLEIAEIAELLEVPEATVLRDWRAARAWLAQEFRGA
jgi:hypothetical protein